MLVQGEIRNQLLQLPVLRFELFEATKLGGAEPPYFFRQLYGATSFRPSLR